MQLRLRDNLPFCSVSVVYRGKAMTLDEVLIDTGSARTIFAADLVSLIDITPEPDDVLETIRGVGGIEIVYTRQVDSIQVDDCTVSPFAIEVGAMDYGFAVAGILGMDFLVQSRAILDLAKLSLVFA